MFTCELWLIFHQNPNLPKRNSLWVNWRQLGDPLPKKKRKWDKWRRDSKRLESAYVRQPRRWEHKRATRCFTQYGSHEEEEDWWLKQFDEKCQHQHHAPKISLPYVKLHSFSGEGDPNIYLGWEAKFEQIFNVHEVQD